MVDFF